MSDYSEKSIGCTKCNFENVVLNCSSGCTCDVVCKQCNTSTIHDTTLTEQSQSCQLSAQVTHVHVSTSSTRVTTGSS